MLANLLMVDHQNTIPSGKPARSKELGKGVIEEGQEQGREKDFSSTLAEVENEQQSHPGPVDESRVERKKGENGEAESEDMKKDASEETESEDIKEDANEGLAKAGKTSGPFLVLDGKTGAGSGNERIVEREELSGSGIGTLAKLKMIKKAPSGPNQANPAGSGLERKQGESEVEKVAATPGGLEKTEKRDGLLRAMSVPPETKGKETSEAAAPPRVVEKTEKTEKADGLLRTMSVPPETKGKETSEATAPPSVVEKTEKTEKRDGLLRTMSVPPETKGKETSEAAATPRGLEKSGNPLTDLGEESGRINRGVQDKEPAAQKFRMGFMKSSTEGPAQKEQGIEASTQRLGIDLKDARSETVKIKVSEGGLIHKKVEKADPGSGENSNLSSRNFSTPHKGTGAISQPKEPQTFTKSAQADTLRQIVNKAALKVESGRSEFKINLKPESLGHLKLQILTENNQVTVRILAENPLVKDMIESNLGQLKANFQNQGLEIEKFDVSVAQDSNKNGARDSRYDSKKMGNKSRGPKKGYDGKVEESEEIDARARRGQGEGAVNFFA